MPLVGSRRAQAAPRSWLRVEWEAFRDRFVDLDGRVVDNGIGGVTHSEGQGYALLLAEAFDDRPTFERVLAWTVRHLARPEDALHPWRWSPARGAVEDRNNATDADLTIA